MATNRHYVVHTIVDRHFRQTADACGLPFNMLKSIFEEIVDTGKATIDQAVSKLPSEFPAAVARSISEGAKSRIDALVTT